MLTSITILPQDITNAQESKLSPSYSICTQCVVAQAIHRITGDKDIYVNYTEALKLKDEDFKYIFYIPRELAILMNDFDNNHLPDTSPFLQTWSSKKTVTK